MFFLASFWSSGKTPVVLIGMQVLHNISINYNSDKLCIEQGVPLSTCETENKVSTMRRKQTKYNQSTKESAILYASNSHFQTAQVDGNGTHFSRDFVLINKHSLIFPLI